MKQLLALSLALFLALSAKAQNCMSLFSYHTNFETVDFNNRSILSNAHYWWNFGDGTSSHHKNPSHNFPENGTYLVSLFVKDTISNCSNFSERWVSVTKYSEEECSPTIKDSFTTINEKTYVILADYAKLCKRYRRSFDVGPGRGSPINNWIRLDHYSSGRFVGRMRYTPTNLSNGYQYREAFKSVPYNYTGNKNYTECSANFEFSVIAEDAGGQTILFEAMNKNALNYEWGIIGFGNPIVSNKDTISHYFPFYYSSIIYLIGLKTEGISGCRDTFYQDILINPTRTNPVGINPAKTKLTTVDVFPNPFSNQTSLMFANPNKLKYSLVITNTLGQAVKTINNIKTGEIKIKRSGLAAGVYFYQLQQNGEQSATGKLIVTD